MEELRGLTGILIVCYLGIASDFIEGKTGVLREGDIIIGGLFPVHFSSSSNSSLTGLEQLLDDKGECAEFNNIGFFLAEAMIYAVERVNKEGLLPSNLSLGYDIKDTCNKVDFALKASLEFVQKRKQKRSQIADDDLGQSNYKWNGGIQLSSSRQNPKKRSSKNRRRKGKVNDKEDISPDHLQDNFIDNRSLSDKLKTSNPMNNLTQSLNTRFYEFNKTQEKNTAGTCTDKNDSKESKERFVDQTNEKVNTQTNLIGVVGTGNSELSMPVNSLLSAYKIPQIDYAASSRILSDKKRFPSFMRTVPSDKLQARVVANMVKHFGWNYVIIIYGDDNYGRPLALSFERHAKTLGICIAQDILLPYRTHKKNIMKAVKKVRSKPKAEVVILFVSEVEVRKIMLAVERQGLTGRTWIASDSWSQNFLILSSHTEKLHGMLGIIHHFKILPDFMMYINRKSKSTSEKNDNIWFKECKHSNCLDNFGAVNNYTSEENDKKSRYNFLYMKNMGRVSYVIDAVYAFAHALKKLCDSHPDDSKSSCLEMISTIQILSVLKTIEFTGTMKKKMSFTKEGDPVLADFDIFNLQKTKHLSSGFIYKNVGRYVSDKNEVDIKDGDIKWWANQRPLSRCSLLCHPGTFMITGKQTCCWKCKECPIGEYSNSSGARICTKCPEAFTSNANRTECMYLRVKYFVWNEPLAILVFLLTSIFLIFTSVTLGIFVRFEKTPVVKASSRNLSILLVIALKLGFLLCFLYPGVKTDIMCQLQTVSFYVIFTFSLSVLLAKINRTVLVFQIRFTKTRFMRSLLSDFSQIVLITALTSVQIALCSLWLLYSPPQIKLVYFPTFRFQTCENNSGVWSYASNIFTFLLSFICTYLAFKSRKLPQNYNEAKFITFAMFIFNIVWLSYTGLYFGSPYNIHAVAFKCIAIIICNAAVLILLFFPKLYVILFKPELNTTEIFRELTWRHVTKKRRSYKMKLLPDGNTDHQHKQQITTVEKTSIGLQTSLCCHEPPLYSCGNGLDKNDINVSNDTTGSPGYKISSERSINNERKITPNKFEPYDVKVVIREYSNERIHQKLSTDV